ncbi:MAG: PAS domain-containing protein [Methanophagales archaeon]|nr:PAS domain-containing protein [Methanophagales archaeon]
MIRKIPDPVHLIFIDKNKKIRYVDDTFAKFVGVESSEELIGKRIGEVLDTKDIKRPIAETVIDKKEPVLNKEIRLKKIEPEEEIKRDEQFIHLLYSCVPVESVDGELLGALEVFVDLTEMERRYKLQECESYDTS